MSGLVTISIRAAPARFRSTSVPAPEASDGSWNDFAVSCAVNQGEYLVSVARPLLQKGDGKEEDAAGADAPALAGLARA